jgi:hypothetical protein
MFGTGFGTVITRPSSHFQFARPFSQSSCLRSDSLLPKAGLKCEENHSVKNPVNKSRAVSFQKTASEQRLWPSLALLPPVEHIAKFGRSEPYNRTALIISNGLQIPSAHFPSTRTSAIWNLLDSVFQDSHSMREKTNGGGTPSVLPS